MGMCGSIQRKMAQAACTGMVMLASIKAFQNIGAEKSLALAA